MTDTPLVREDDTAPARPAARPRWIPLAIAAIVLAAIAAGAGLWFLGARQTIPEWERLTQVNLAAPAGDAFQPDTPWFHLSLQPGRPGEENSLRVALSAPRGTPVPSDAETPRITALTVQPLAVDTAPVEPVELQPETGDGAVLGASSTLDRAGWWRVRAEVEAEGAAEDAELFLLLPDPNLNGPNAIPGFGSSAEGEAVYQRGLAGLTGLRSVRFTQWIADGKGNAAVSEHAVTAGGDGVPPGFSYRAAGGMEAVIIGTTRWVKLSENLEWQEQEGAVVVPPADWGEEYDGATGFTLLGEEEIGGERCQLVAFVAPEVTEPRRRVVAWYLWWVGAETGYVRQEAMVSRVHYMFNQFGGFDEPLVLTVPDGVGTPPPALAPLPPSPDSDGRGGTSGQDAA